MGREVARGHGVAALALGAAELVFGLIIVICSFVIGGKITNASKTWTPYWAGIPYMIPGILGIVTGVTKNYCAMMAFMILNIICFIITGVSAILIFLIMAVFAAIASDWQKYCSDGTYYGKKACICNRNGTGYRYYVEKCDHLKAIMSLLYAIAIFGVIAAIVSLAASILGCIAVCCSNNTQPGTVIVQQPVVMQQQQQPPMYQDQYPQK